MLDPNDRFTLVEALRPPEDCELSWAFGTSFTLDLISALTCPLSFAMFDWEDDEGRPRIDPHALLEALRRYAGRMSIFCQAGQISVPPPVQGLLPYLEDAIIESNAPTPNHIFHPKLWVLRFESLDGAVKYRVLCLTRNLTFDRCWDAALVLEGEFADRQLAHAANHPLGEFVSGVARLARDPLPKRVADEIARIDHEIRRTTFELPEPFDEYKFWPLGLPGGRSWPFEGRIDRAMVVSPFIQPRALRRLTEEGDNHLLVSRIESLQELSAEDLTGFSSTYVLNEAADVEAQGQPDEDPSEQNLLRGLHAKIYVAEGRGAASIWTGSANATNGAFEGNVEFLVELIGSKAKCGIDAVLGDDASLGMMALLQRFEPSPEPKLDEVGEALQKKADDIRYALGQTRLIARAEADDDGSYTVHVETANGSALKFSSDAVVRFWPARLAEGSAITVTAGSSRLGSFPNTALEALTAFFVFDVTVREGKRTLPIRFTLNISLIGAPDDRLDRVLADMLKDKEQVLRFLLFLLGDADSDPEANLLLTDLLGASGNGAARPMELPLLEVLVRTLARNPERLDNVANLIESLKKTPDGESRIPDGFSAIWEPIWAARSEMARG